jgi:hypothetical protein
MAGFVLPVCLLLLAATAGCRTTPRATVVPEPYLRITRSNSTVALQVAVRQLLPRNPRQPVVWLVGASHIGEATYFIQLQHRLDAADLVLYEGVGGRQLSEAPPADTNTAPASTRGSLQTTLAESLGLKFQLAAINYHRAHFQNSDLTLEEIQHLFVRQRNASQQQGEGAEEEFDRMIGLMDGSSIWSLVAQAGLRILEVSPKLQGMMRLVLIETLGRVHGDLADMQGVSSSIQELLRVLIRERNARVMQDVKNLLRQRAPPPTIAIFYGAGHLDDLEKRLVTEQAFRPGITEWHTAFSVNPETAGLSAGEVSLVQTLVEYQLQQILKRPAGAAEAHRQTTRPRRGGPPAEKR